jgi:mRNA-degrading endonuclease RelE of RelBE toxin-antitoxin system
MKFDVKLVESADKDLDHYMAYEQRFILKSVYSFLKLDANVETKKRKQLRPNPIAPWELRIAKYRVFYEIKEERLVRVLAIGHKEHNELFIRGERIEI